jgi:hypothetical protein
MKNPTWIVIDKDFLQADQDGLGIIINEGFRLLITERTAYEISTTKPGVRRKCCQILERFRDSVDFVNEGGNSGLLGYEIKEKKCSRDILQNYIQSLPCNLEQFLHSANSPRWEENLEKGPAEEFEKIVIEMTSKIPSLNKDGLKDCNIVRDFYGKLTSQSREKLPRPESIDENWIIFRMLQIDYWMVLDRAQVNNKNRLHDRIDARVLAVALLTQGLATNERLMKNIFGFFLPTGKLFSVTNRISRSRPGFFKY